MLSRLVAALVVLSAIQAGSAAHAEGRLRLVEQFGTVYLPLHVMRDQKLIENTGNRPGSTSRSKGQAQRRRREPDAPTVVRRG